MATIPCQAHIQPGPDKRGPGGEDPKSRYLIQWAKAGSRLGPGAPSRPVITFDAVLDPTQASGKVWRAIHGGKFFQRPKKSDAEMLWYQFFLDPATFEGSNEPAELTTQAAPNEPGSPAAAPPIAVIADQIPTLIKHERLSPIQEAYRRIENLEARSTLQESKLQELKQENSYLRGDINMLWDITTTLTQRCAQLQRRMVGLVSDVDVHGGWLHVIRDDLSRPGERPSRTRHLPLSLPCDRHNPNPLGEDVAGEEWERDLTQEGIEPHPGPSEGGGILCYGDDFLYLTACFCGANWFAHDVYYAVEDWWYGYDPEEDLTEEGIEPNPGPKNTKGPKVANNPKRAKVDRTRANKNDKLVASALLSDLQQAQGALDNAASREPCRHYAKHGTCRYGPGCKFSHEEQTPTTTSSTSGPITFGAFAAGLTQAGITPSPVVTFSAALESTTTQTGLTNTPPRSTVDPTAAALAYFAAVGKVIREPARPTEPTVHHHTIRRNGTVEARHCPECRRQAYSLSVPETLFDAPTPSGLPEPIQPVTLLIDGIHHTTELPRPLQGVGVEFSLRDELLAARTKLSKGKAKVAQPSVPTPPPAPPPNATPKQMQRMIAISKIPRAPPQPDEFLMQVGGAPPCPPPPPMTMTPELLAEHNAYYLEEELRREKRRLTKAQLPEIVTLQHDTQVDWVSPLYLKIWSVFILIAWVGCTVWDVVDTHFWLTTVDVWLSVALTGVLSLWLLRTLSGPAWVRHINDIHTRQYKGVKAPWLKRELYEVPVDLRNDLMAQDRLRHLESMMMDATYRRTYYFEGRAGKWFRYVIAPFLFLQRFTETATTKMTVSWELYTQLVNYHNTSNRIDPEQAAVRIDAWARTKGSVNVNAYLQACGEPVIGATVKLAWANFCDAQRKLSMLPFHIPPALDALSHTGITTSKSIYQDWTTLRRGRSSVPSEPSLY